MKDDWEHEMDMRDLEQMLGPDYRPLAESLERHIEQLAAVCRYLRGEVERLEIMGAVEMPCFDIVARKMSDIAAKPYDLERAHGNADDLLCEVL